MFRSIAGRMYASARQINSSSIPGDSWNFLRSSIHKDNIKTTMKVAFFLIYGGLLIELARLSSITTEIRNDLKEMNESNQVGFKAINESIQKMIESNQDALNAMNQSNQDKLNAMNQSNQKMNESIQDKLNAMNQSNQVEFKAIGEKFATLEISIRKDMHTESDKIQNNMILVLSSRLNENHEKEKPINQMNRNITATNDEVKPTSSMLSNNN